MTKTMKAGALLVAGVFALSGCGSADPADPADPAADSSASAESASPTPTPAPAPAAGQEQYTAAELEAALTAVKEDQGLAGEVANDAALRPLVEETSLTGVRIAPEECNILVSSFFDAKIAGGNLATLGLDGSDTLMLISYEDTSVLDKQAGNSERLIKDCGNFTMELDGTVITGSVESMEASTDAPSTQAYRTELTREGISEGAIIQVSGRSGTLNLSATLFDPADADAAVATAERAINAAVAELRKN